jgi:transposase
MRCFIETPNIYLHIDVVDFRKSINGLALIVEQELNRDPFCEEIYVFCNRGRDKLKILYWDKTGFALWYKRLEKSRFKWPRVIKPNAYQIDEQQLHWLLDGYDIIGHQPVYFSKVG